MNWKYSASVLHKSTSPHLLLVWDSLHVDRFWLGAWMRAGVGTWEVHVRLLFNRSVQLVRCTVSGIHNTWGCLAKTGERRAAVAGDRLWRQHSHRRRATAGRSRRQRDSHSVLFSSTTVLQVHTTYGQEIHVRQHGPRYWGIPAANIETTDRKLQDCLSVEGRLPDDRIHRHAFFAPVTLTFTRWPWLRTWPEASEDVHAYQEWIF